MSLGHTQSELTSRSVLAWHDRNCNKVGLTRQNKLPHGGSLDLLQCDMTSCVGSQGLPGRFSASFFKPYLNWAGNLLTAGWRR